MQLVDGRVTHYRSINDSGIVTFDPEITNIVGVTGSGKTSFLKMLSGVSDRIRFGEIDLSHESDVLARFHGGKAQAGDIVQLRATFRVEDADRARLPPRCRKAGLIEVVRTLAGGITLSVDGEALPKADIRNEADSILKSANKVAKMLYSLVRDDPEDSEVLAQAVDEAVSSFREADFYDRNGTRYRPIYEWWGVSWMVIACKIFHANVEQLRDNHKIVQKMCRLINEKRITMKQLWFLKLRCADKYIQ